MSALMYTRRRLLTRSAPGLALAALLPACGRSLGPVATTASGPRAAPPDGTPAPDRPGGIVATPSASATRSPGLLPPSVPPTSTPTLSAASPRFLGDAGCSTAYRPDRKPSDPYSLHMAGEAKAYPFSEKVRQLAQLLVVGTVRDILPSRWVTPDGRRPANPHTGNDLLLITPVRVEVERVAKGAYALPDIYLAAPGGRIGEDCASYSGSGPWPEFRFGGRYLYLHRPIHPRDSRPGACGWTVSLLPRRLQLHR